MKGREGVWRVGSLVSIYIYLGFPEIVFIVCFFFLGNLAPVVWQVKNLFVMNIGD